MSTSTCRSGNEYMSKLVGGLDTQMNNARGGILAQVSSFQQGGRRRSRKRMVQGGSRRKKTQSRRIKSRKLIRKRK